MSSELSELDKLRRLWQPHHIFQFDECQDRLTKLQNRVYNVLPIRSTDNRIISTPAQAIRQGLLYCNAL